MQPLSLPGGEVRLVSKARYPPSARYVPPEAVIATTFPDFDSAYFGNRNCTWALSCQSAPPFGLATL